MKAKLHLLMPENLPQMNWRLTLTISQIPFEWVGSKYFYTDSLVLQQYATIYYQTTPRQEKVRHLSSIITGHVFETKQTVELWERDKSKVTYIGPGGDRKILTHMASSLWF